MAPPNCLNTYSSAPCKRKKALDGSVIALRTARTCAHQKFSRHERVSGTRSQPVTSRGWHPSATKMLTRRQLNHTQVIQLTRESTRETETRPTSCRKVFQWVIFCALFLMWLRKRCELLTKRMWKTMSKLLWKVREDERVGKCTQAQKVPTGCKVRTCVFSDGKTFAGTRGSALTIFLR